MKKRFLIILVLAFALLVPNVNAADLYGTVEKLRAYDSAIIENNDSKDISITFGPESLVWSKADKSVGRMTDGYWIGFQINAPIGYKTGKTDGAYYTKTWYGGVDGGKSYFDVVKDGDNYLYAYFEINEVRLNAAKELNKPYNLITYSFDWDADGKTDQTLKVYINPNGITLEDTPDDIAKVVVSSEVGSYVFYVEKGKSLKEYISESDMDKLNKLMTPPDGKELVGLFNGENEFTIETIVESDLNITVLFDTIDNPLTGDNTSILYGLSIISIIALGISIIKYNAIKE